MDGRAFGDAFMMLGLAVFFMVPTIVGLVGALIWVSFAGVGLMQLSPLLLGVAGGIAACSWLKRKG